MNGVQTCALPIYGLDKFVAKACDCLQRGIHLLIIDLLPTTPRDPQGVHGTIWSEIEGGDYVAPADKPLTSLKNCERPVPPCGF